MAAALRPFPVSSMISPGSTGRMMPKPMVSRRTVMKMKNTALRLIFVCVIDV